MLFHSLYEDGFKKIEITKPHFHLSTMEQKESEIFYELVKLKLYLHYSYSYIETGGLKLHIHGWLATASHYCCKHHCNSTNAHI